MAFKPPITTDELRDIGIRKDAADINRSLWEIKRLRTIMLRTNQVLRARSLSEAWPAGIVARCLLDESRAVRHGRRQAADRIGVLHRPHQVARP
jgi:hypothetical protein